MLSESLKEYLVEFSSSLSTQLQKVLDTTKQKQVEGAHMMCGSEVANLLDLLVKIHNPKLVLDIGSYVGFSALTLAESTSDQAVIYSCERDPSLVKIANENISQHPNGNKVRLICDDALKFLEDFDQAIDFTFLDADKKYYLDYYNMLVEKTRPGGLIVIDDVLWKGEVTAPQKPKIEVMNHFNKVVKHDPRVQNILLPVRNGINLIYKHS